MIRKPRRIWYLRLDAPGQPARQPGAEHDAADRSGRRTRRTASAAASGCRPATPAHDSTYRNMPLKGMPLASASIRKCGLRSPSARSRAAAGRPANGWRCVGVQRLGQRAPHRPPQQRADRGQEPEDRVPVGVHEQQAADHRRHRRRDAEVDGHLRHHALRVGRREHVADDGARHHHAGAGAHALQRAEEHQLADASAPARSPPRPA